MKTLTDLGDDFRKQRMTFIHTELEAGTTFANVAQTERAAGNEDRAHRNLVHARRAYEEASRRMEECRRAEAPEAYDQAVKKLDALNALLTSLTASGAGQ